MFLRNFLFGKKLFSEIFHFGFAMFLFIPPVASSQPQCGVDCHSNGNLVLGGDQLKADKPLIGKSDFADVVSPAPVLSYTPVRFAQRLIEMAEGPSPTKEDFEREFGVELVLVNKLIDGDGFFLVYRGDASALPFLNRSGNVGYDKSGEWVSVYFNFQDRMRVNKKFCIPSSHIYRYFDENWVRYRLPVAFPGDLRRYRKKIDGINRQVDISPNEESVSGCVDFFSLIFGVR